MQNKLFTVQLYLAKVTKLLSEPLILTMAQKAYRRRHGQALIKLGICCTISKLEIDLPDIKDQ
jgi:hypothetical protein